MRYQRQLPLFVGLIIGLLLPLSALAAPPAAPAAQSNPIEISVEPGFDGLVKRGDWMPVQINVSNVGQGVEGVLQIESDGIFYRLPISLPAQSEKRVEMSVAVGTGTPDAVELFQDGTQLVREPFTFRALAADDSLLYGVVSSNGEPVEFLEKVDGGRSEAVVAFLSIDSLPTNPAAWRSLDVLIFNDVDTNQMTAGQRLALENWVQSGGQLVVTGGAGWQKTTAALADWLPVTVTGSTSVDALPGFEEQVGETFRDPGPYVIAESSLRGGESVYFEGGTPILARRSMGRGSVFFMALDPQFAPLIDWDGSEEMWGEIAAFVPFPAMWESGFPNEGSAANAIDNLPGLELPSAFLLIGFIGLYIVVIGPLNYLFLNRMQRREIAWLSIPVVIVVFSVFAYLIGFNFKGNQLFVNQLAMVTGRIGEPTVDVDVALGVYSPRRGVFDISTEGDLFADKLDSFSFNDFGDEFFIQQGDGRDTTIGNVLLDVGGIRAFKLRGARPAPPIEANVTLFELAESDAFSAQIEITNNTGQMIENATILYQSAPFRDDVSAISATSFTMDTITIGSIRPGETINRTIRINNRISDRFIEATESGASRSIGQRPVDNGGYTYVESPLEVNSYNIAGNYDYNDPSAVARHDLLSALVPNDSNSIVYIPSNYFVFTGWADGGQIDVGIPGTRFDSAGQTFYILEIPYQN